MTETVADEKTTDSPLSVSYGVPIDFNAGRLVKEHNEKKEVEAVREIIEPEEEEKVEAVLQTDEVYTANPSSEVKESEKGEPNIAEAELKSDEFHSADEENESLKEEIKEEVVAEMLVQKA
jgi:hypothetical protein